MLEILTRVSGWAGGRAQALAWYRGDLSRRLATAPPSRWSSPVRPAPCAIISIRSRWAALREIVGLAYRAHDPRWSFRPLSGDGAAVHGGRFNPKGTPALYLALDPMTAIKEASQGFARKFEPCVLCTYEIDCQDIVELRTRSCEGRLTRMREASLVCGRRGGAIRRRGGSPSA